MGLDEDVAAALARPPWDALGVLAGPFAALGSVSAWWLLVLALAATRRWAWAVPLALALLATDAAVWALKEAIARPRPDGATFAGADFAFPSGHAARGGVGAGLAWALGAPRAWQGVALAFAALVGLSRLVARAHWLTDVLAGLALGAVLAIAVAEAWKRDAAGVRTRALAAAERLGRRAADAARTAPP